MTSNVKFLELPLAIVTIIVSHIARDNAKTMEAIIPDKAAGITILQVTSIFNDQSPNAPSRKLCGTAFIASSDKKVTIRMIMIPITNPGLKIFVACKLGKMYCNNGVTKVNAKKPYTIVGIPAKISIVGFNICLALFDAYSLK